MPLVMSLEGPRPDRLAELRGRLYGALPRPWWRANNALAGVFTPFRAHPIIALAALVGGAWYANKTKRRR